MYHYSPFDFPILILLFPETFSTLIFHSAVAIQQYLIYYIFFLLVVRKISAMNRKLYFSLLSIGRFDFIFQRNFCEKPLLKTTLRHIYPSHYMKLDYSKGPH